MAANPRPSLPQAVVASQVSPGRANGGERERDQRINREGGGGEGAMGDIEGAEGVLISFSRRVRDVRDSKAPAAERDDSQSRAGASASLFPVSETLI